MKLFSIVKPEDRLILIKSALPYRSRLILAQVAVAAAVLTLVGWLLASRIHPAFLVVAGALLVVVLAVATRAMELQRVARQSDSFCFDRTKDAILRNGQPIAAISDMDHILVRRVVPETEATSEAQDYALLVSLSDSRRIMLAEASGIPGARQEIETAANEIASFAQVRVEQGERFESEDWMDIT